MSLRQVYVPLIFKPSEKNKYFCLFLPYSKNAQVNNSLYYKYIVVYYMCFEITNYIYFQQKKKIISLSGWLIDCAS